MKVFINKLKIAFKRVLKALNNKHVKLILDMFILTLLFIFVIFFIYVCIVKSNKNNTSAFETAYADEVYYDGDYMTIDIGNANLITTDERGEQYNIMPSIRSLYLGISSAQNNSFDFYYPYLRSFDGTGRIFDYQYVNIMFQRSLSDGTNYIYRYLFNSFDNLPYIFGYFNMNDVNNSFLEYQSDEIYEIQLDLYNNSNLFNLAKTFSIRSYVYINSSDYLVNYYAFYDTLENLLGVLYFKTNYDRTDTFPLGSNLYTCYNIPVFDFKGIEEYSYNAGYDAGYDDGLNASDDGSYQDGYDDGYREGYDEGHYDGEQAGYDEGYGDGYFDGSEGPLKIFETIRIGFTRLLKIEIFPNFSIGSIFLLMLSISLLFFVVRVFMK